MTKTKVTIDLCGDAEDADGDDVGYKKPPKKHQFQRGKSGNPKGRPKKLKTLLDAVLEELHKPVNVIANGKPTKVDRLALLVNLLFKSALEFNKSAISILFSLIEKAEAERALKEAAAKATDSQTFGEQPFSWAEEEEKLYAEFLALDFTKKEECDGQQA